MRLEGTCLEGCWSVEQERLSENLGGLSPGWRMQDRNREYNDEARMVTVINPSCRAINPLFCMVFWVVGDDFNWEHILPFLIFEVWKLRPQLSHAMNNSIPFCLSQTFLIGCVPVVFWAGTSAALPHAHSTKSKNPSFLLGDIFTYVIHIFVSLKNEGPSD